MATFIESFTQLRGSVGRGINWRFFLEDNVTGSWYQTVWVALLAIVTGVVSASQLSARPTSTTIILVVWAAAILMMAYGVLFHRHNPASRWLKENLFTSISNTLITLLIILTIVVIADGLWQWGYVDATFDSVNTAPEFRSDGATWGVLWAAKKLLMVGLIDEQYVNRVWLALGFILGLWALTFVGRRPAVKEAAKPLRLITNGLWLFSPVILYIFLAGVAEGPINVRTILTGVVVLLAFYLLFWWQRVINFTPVSLAITAAAWPVVYLIWYAIGQSGSFEPINADSWGGLMLTLIIASSVIILSLPFGMVLALARQSNVFGIPSWFYWPIAIGLAIYYSYTSTPDLLDTSRNAFEQITSFWPLAILFATYFFHRFFKGNMVAGASTTFIELIRSVPLITLLFMGINMAPFFVGADVSIDKPWLVIAGYTFFSSAYMAETIRGGLQAIPKGQYEAADSLGFNTLQKMRFIILPQALRIVIPAIVGQFIGAFKSSSLVSIVGLRDFLGIQTSIGANDKWFGLKLELFVLMAVVYFLGSFIMSTYSRRMEARLAISDQ